MSIHFSGSKAASITAGAIFVLVVVGIAFLVGGDEFVFAVRTAPLRVAEFTHNTFPWLWEYKWYFIVFGAVAVVISILRAVNEGPVKKY